MKVINKIDPIKQVRIKDNNEDLFEREVVDLIHFQEKLFVKLKKLKLHIDEENTKNLGTKFKNYYKKKKKQKINEPKLW